MTNPESDEGKIISTGGHQMCKQEIKGQPNSVTERSAGENDTAPESAVILIVEDNVAEAAACREILEHAGYHVQLAPDGHTGLEILQRNPAGIDLIILDWILPDMSGDQWLEYFLEVAPDVKVVFTTGKFITEAVRQQLAPKVQGFLKKPFTGAQLLDTVLEALCGDRT